MRVNAGMGYRWSSAGPDVMGNSCDVGPYRAARLAAVAAQAARRLTLPDEGLVALRVEGETAPPKLVITGPGGRRIVSPSEAGAIEDGRYVIVEDPAERVTHVLNVEPRGGSWTLETQPGSSPIADVRRADTAEPPTVVGDVGGRGSSRVLGYAYAAGGHEVTFVERSDDLSEGKGPRTGGGQAVPRTEGRARGPRPPAVRSPPLHPRRGRGRDAQHLRGREQRRDRAGRAPRRDVPGGGRSPPAAAAQSAPSAPRQHRDRHVARPCRTPKGRRARRAGVRPGGLARPPGSTEPRGPARRSPADEGGA